VRQNRLVRAASLYEMTGGDRALLESHGVGTVLDLRSRWETQVRPTKWPGVRIVSVPLVTDEAVRDVTGRFEAGTVRAEELADWWTLAGVYEAPERHAESFRIIFETFLALPDGEAALFHCRGGKDRTGTVAAFLLHVLGVTREELLADFLVTNDAHMRRARTRDIGMMREFARRSGLDPSALFSLMSVREEWLDRLFRIVAERFGSVTDYVAGHLGIGRDGIEGLRERYLV
jgi:protein-tyrosine phosphatase